MTEGKNKQGQNASPSQHDRFIDAARALGCDEDPAAFDGKLKVIARHKPKVTPPERPKRTAKAP
jgi:hypothetical protein